MSVRDELKARRERNKTRDLHLDYEVPGFEPAQGEKSDLVVRFNVAPYEVVARYQIAFDPAEQYQLDLDAIVQSCREILIREDGKLVPYVEGQTTTFGQIDEAMGFQAETARKAVEEVFPNDLAVGDCAGVLIAWSRTAHRKAEDKATGE